MTTYNHAVTLAFEIQGSTTETGGDITAEQFEDALKRRLEEMRVDAAFNAKQGQGPEELTKQWHEACLPPFDTYDEGKY